MIRIGALDPRQRANALRVMIITTRMLHGLFQRFLPRMSKGRVSNIMGEAKRFGQVLVEPQLAGDDAADLRDLDAVCKPCAIVVAVGGNEHLGLRAKSAKGDRMDDPVAITLELAAGAARTVAVFGEFASARMRRIGSEGSSMHGALRLR